MKKFLIILIQFYMDKCFTISGVIIPKSIPQQMPVSSTAAPNIPAMPLYFGATQLKVTIYY